MSLAELNEYSVDILEQITDIGLMTAICNIFFEIVFSFQMFFITITFDK